MESNEQQIKEVRSKTEPENSETKGTTPKSDYGRRKKAAFRNLVNKVYISMLDEGEFSEPTKKKHKRNNAKTDSDVDGSSSNEEMVCFEYEDTNLLNRSVVKMYNNEEDFRNLTPSRNPQSFAKSNIQNESAPTGWTVDKIGNKKVLKPQAEVINRHSNSSQSSISKLIQEDNTETTSSTRLPRNLSGDQGEKNNITTPKTKKKSDKVSSAKKKKQKGESKLDKELKDMKQETDDLIMPNRAKFSLLQSDVTFADVAGNNAALHELSRLLLHMSHPELYQVLGVSPPRGILLHGPPGCGKTLLGTAIAGQLDLPLMKLVGPELVTGVSGESERRIRDMFDTAVSSAPCVLFIDEIDAVGQKRENSSKDMERRIVAQLLSCLDDLNKGCHQVMVVGATNKPDVLDPALRRAGRFDREICMGIPDEKARKQILAVLCKDFKLAEDINFDLVARLTPGFSYAPKAVFNSLLEHEKNFLFLKPLLRLSTPKNNEIRERVFCDFLQDYVGADLMSLCREAAMRAVTRMFDVTTVTNDANWHDNANILEWLKDRTPFPDEKLNALSIETNDFQLAVPDVQPSAKREGFATVPDVTWDDVGALENIRDELSIAILGPVRNPAAFAALGLTQASGILLAGPPGCGKTLLAKAIANESGINFVSVKGPELLNMYVGESERAVRQCFERARNSSPCVIFFDELDSLCPRRSAVESSASARVVNQMLTELDGLVSRKQVFVMAATNRPDIIDPAVLRPGRLDRTLYVGIPSPSDRVKILQTITKNGTKPMLAADVSLEELGSDSRCDGFTGADMSALVREASLNAIRKTVKHNWDVLLPNEETNHVNVEVSRKNFDDAFIKVCPSISKKDRVMYEDMRRTLER